MSWLKLEQKLLLPMKNPSTVKMWCPDWKWCEIDPKWLEKTKECSNSI